MVELKEDTIADLHAYAVEYVAKHGYEVITEDGEKTLQTEPLVLVCKTPLREKMLSPRSMLKRLFVEQYTERLLNGYDKDTHFDYDYHTRLFEYSNGVTTINQIDYIIDRLKKAPTSRRAVAITWNPATDVNELNVPCLQLLQFTIVNNKLNLYVVFRSNDMLSAFGSNAYALVRLMQLVAKKVGVEIGEYRHIALVPHIYYLRDGYELEKFVPNFIKYREVLSLSSMT